MNELMQFHFVRPWWLLALIPAGLLLTYIWRAQKLSGAWQKVIAEDFLSYLLEGRLNKRSRLPLFLLAAAWLLTVLALAGPVWKQLPQAVYKNHSAAVIVWDLSASMYATDSQPNRFTLAKHKLLDILHARTDGFTALVVYAGDAHVVTPLTDDTNTIENMVASLDPDIMPIPGSNAPAAIKMAIDLLQQGGEAHGQVLLISDGIEQDQIGQITDLAKSANVTISALGVGTIEGDSIKLPNGQTLKDNNGAIVIPKLTRDAFQTLTKQTNGIYVETQTDDSDTNALLAKLATSNFNQQKMADRFANTWQEEGAWLVLLLLPLAAICFRRGWLLTVCVLVALSPVQHAEASAFKTPDQMGYAAYQQKDYEKAAELFTDPEWKGTSFYKAGNYDKAAAAFAQTDTAPSNYNRGNALVELGAQNETGNKLQEAKTAYEDAIKAYDHSLELQSPNGKAQANKKIAEDKLDALKKKMEEQQNQQQQQQQQQQKENGDQSKDQTSQDQSQNNDQKNQTNDGKQSNDQNNQQQNQQQQQQNNNGATSQNPAQNPATNGQQQPEQQNKSQAAQTMDKNSGSSDQKNSADAQSANGQPTATDIPQDAKITAGKSSDESKEQGGEKSPMGATDDRENKEEKQTLDQLMNKVPDDPGGLLERKFRYQSQQNNSTVNSDKTW